MTHQEILKKLKEIDTLQAFLSNNKLPNATQQSFDEDFKLKYIYDSNAIEGNTLTLHETKVVLEGVTVGGKTLREHFEIINHAEAIDYIEDLAKTQEPLSEYQIKSIHHLILKGIYNNNAGIYRNNNVFIAGAKHIPPDYYNVQAEMDRFMSWYHNEAQNLHPVIRASRVHIDFVKIHPFVDGNGRTSRLLMNLELLKAHYTAINIKSDRKSEYYEALEVAHCDNEFSLFDNLVADYVLQRLEEKKDLFQRNIRRQR